MGSITILTGRAESYTEAKTKLVEKIRTYMVSGGWDIQGGLTHTILPPTEDNPKHIHYFSILMIQR